MITKICSCHSPYVAIADSSSVYPLLQEPYLHTSVDPIMNAETACTNWWEMMHGLVNQMTSMVSTVSNLRSTQSFLRARLPPMRTMSVKLITVCSSVPARQNEERSSAALALVRCITDFTRLLTTLVPQLDRLGAQLSRPTACSIGTAEEDLFWVLWGVLVASSSALVAANRAFKDLLPPKEHPSYTSLCSAFGFLLTWLLQMSQSPAWVSMLPQHGRMNRNKGLLVILSIANNCLAHTIPPPFDDVLLNDCQTILLPPLCSIVSEQFLTSFPALPQLPPDPPSHSQATVNRQGVPDAHIVHISSQGLMSSLANQIILRIGMSGGADISSGLSFLTAPSVIMFLKQYVSLPKEVSHTAEHGLLYINSLLLIYKRSLTLSDTKLNEELASLGLHPSESYLFPMPSPKALAVDAMLLHTLSRYIEGSPAERHELLTLQMLVLGTWQVACTQHVAASPVLAVMASSLAGLAKQCTTYALQLMRHLQGEGQGCGQPRLLSTQQPLHQVQQSQEQNQATLQAQMQLADFNFDVIIDIQDMMFPTFRFILASSSQAYVHSEWLQAFGGYAWDGNINQRHWY